MAIPKADALLYVQDFRAEEKSLSIDYAGFREEQVETLEKVKFISRLIILIIHSLN